MSIKKNILIFTLLLTSLESFASDMCPSTANFTHLPSGDWTLNAPGWSLSYLERVNIFPIQQMPEDTPSWVFIDFVPNHPTMINCEYKKSSTYGAAQLYVGKHDSNLTVNNIPPNFEQDSEHGYRCAFKAGNPSACQWF